ncbi:TolC family protein [Flavicella sediminum]|uniref:TolC family protein n=1 Tax=Flavicella sediminum TaxID=2585141 RepID=UPI00111F3EDC|nr:TolC family protein [Flavicella sediminum]
MKTKISIFFLFCTVALSAQQKKWTLKECIAYAIEHNISIQQSELDIEVAEINKNDAIGTFLPNLNANVRHSWNTGLNTNPVTNTNVTATTQNTNFGISSSVVLYDGLKNINRLHRSNLLLLANQYQLEDMKDNISLRIANAYLQILFNRESLKSLQVQNSLNEKEYERTKELVKEGVKPKGDILEIEATMAKQEQDMVAMENNLTLSKLSLFNLLALDNFEGFDIAISDVTMEENSIIFESPTSVFNKAVNFRNDIKLSEVQIQLAKNDLKIAKASYLPTLTGSFGFSTNYFQSKLLNLPSFRDQVDNNKGHAFGLGLSIPIFNRFQIRNSVKRNKINVKSAQLNLEQSKINLRDKVQQAYNDVQGALKTYQANEKTLIARKEAFKYSEEKFNVGLLNAFNYNQIKTTLENAEISLIRAKYDYLFKIKVLEYYFGVPLQ